MQGAVPNVTNIPIITIELFKQQTFVRRHVWKDVPATAIKVGPRRRKDVTRVGVLGGVHAQGSALNGVVRVRVPPTIDHHVPVAFLDGAF
eukprot:scaffold1171_cov177-Amphora_coffeaeformis.AAC.22